MKYIYIYVQMGQTSEMVSEMVCRSIFPYQWVFQYFPTLFQTKPSFWPANDLILVQMGMDQYLLIPFLGGWTSILTQLFWCSLQGYLWFWHTAKWFSKLSIQSHRNPINHWMFLGCPSWVAGAKTHKGDTKGPQKMVSKNSGIVSMIGDLVGFP